MRFRCKSNYSTRATDNHSRFVAAREIPIAKSYYKYNQYKYKSDYRTRIIISRSQLVSASYNFKLKNIFKEFSCGNLITNQNTFLSIEAAANSGASTVCQK